MQYIITLVILAQAQTSHCAPLPKVTQPVFFRLGGAPMAEVVHMTEEAGQVEPLPAAPSPADAPGPQRSSTTMKVEFR